MRRWPRGAKACAQSGPSTIPANEIVAEARQHGLIILIAGEKIVRLLPPLTINQAEIDILTERLVTSLEHGG